MPDLTDVSTQPSPRPTRLAALLYLWLLCPSCRTTPAPTEAPITKPGSSPESLADPHRPALHFTAAQGWINDPNGLVFHDGLWHLAYQAEWPRRWDRALSKDLLHWERQGPMLEPDAAGHIWSGSAALDAHDTTGVFDGGGGLVAAYTYWGPESAQQKRQSVALAFSRDGGLAWTKFAENPVLRDPDLIDFRDPKIFWHAPTRRWIAIVSIAQAMRIYSAPNLKTWLLRWRLRWPCLRSRRGRRASVNQRQW